MPDVGILAVTSADRAERRLARGRTSARGRAARCARPHRAASRPPSGRCRVGQRAGRTSGQSRMAGIGQGAADAIAGRRTFWPVGDHPGTLPPLPNRRRRDPRCRRHCCCSGASVEVTSREAVPSAVAPWATLLYTAAPCGPRGRGGIGRRGGFRCRWSDPWGFESLRPHQRDRGGDTKVSGDTRSRENSRSRQGLAAETPSEARRAKFGKKASHSCR